MTDIKESLLYHDLSESRRSIIDTCAEYLIKLWSEHRLITYYTDHGYKHSVRILAKIEELLDLDRTGTKNNISLSDDEKFLLILSVIFHDIGMQCDLYKNVSVKNRVEEDYGVEFNSKFSGKYTEENMQEQRKYHHLVSAAWLLDARLKNHGDLSQAIYKIRDSEINCIRKICRYHSKLIIYDCMETHPARPVRVCFLAALLRIGDELDIGEDRVIPSTPDIFFLPDEDGLYWYLHSRTIVGFEDSVISVKICLSSYDYRDYRHDFAEYLEKLFKKNDEVVDVLWRKGLHLRFYSAEKSVIELPETPNIPPECLKILFTPKIQSQVVKTESQTAIDTTYSMDRTINVNKGKTLEDMMEWEF